MLMISNENPLTKSCLQKVLCGARRGKGQVKFRAEIFRPNALIPLQPTPLPYLHHQPPIPSLPDGFSSEEVSLKDVKCVPRKRGIFVYVFTVLKRPFD